MRINPLVSIAAFGAANNRAPIINFHSFEGTLNGAKSRYDVRAVDNVAFESETLPEPVL